MAKRISHKTRNTIVATLVLAVFLTLPWLLGSCEFDQSSIHLKHPPKRVVLDDLDGGH
jgi:hypothetical protein